MKYKKNDLIISTLGYIGIVKGCTIYNKTNYYYIFWLDQRIFRNPYISEFRIKLYKRKKLQIRLP